MSNTLGEENLSGCSDGEDDGTVRKDGAQRKRQSRSISQWDGGDSSDESDTAAVAAKRPRTTDHQSPSRPARKQRLATPPLASTTLRIAEAREAAAPPQVVDRLVCERHMRLDDLANRHGRMGERVPRSFQYMSEHEEDEQTQQTQPYRPPPGASASSGFRPREPGAGVGHQGMGFGDTKFQSPSPTAVHTPVATRKSNGAGAGKWLNGVEGSSPLLPVQLAQHYQAAMASDSSSSPSPQQSRRQAERAREGKQGHGHILRTGAMGVITDDIHADNDLILRQAALGSQEAQAMIDRSPSREWPEDFKMRKDGPWQREEDGVVAEHLRQDSPQLIGPLGKEQLSLSEEAALDGFEALSEDDGSGGVNSPPATSRVVGPAPSAPSNDEAGAASSSNPTAWFDAVDIANDIAMGAVPSNGLDEDLVKSGGPPGMRPSPRE